MNNQHSIDDLIRRLREEIDEIDLSNLDPETVFLEIEGWNSLYSLVVMALCSTDYNVELSAKQIKAIKTIQDLFDILQQETH